MNSNTKSTHAEHMKNMTYRESWKENNELHKYFCLKQTEN